MFNFLHKLLTPFSHFDFHGGHSISIKIAPSAAILSQSGRKTFPHETDAMDLIAKFGGQAYYEAEQLSKGHGASEQPRSHWARVKIEIARLRPIDTGRPTPLTKCRDF